MKQINEHTPLPWFGWQICDCSIGITSVDGEYQSLDTDEALANRDFIITACNNFYKMKALLETHVLYTPDCKRVFETQQLLKELDK